MRRGAIALILVLLTAVAAPAAGGPRRARAASAKARPRPARTPSSVPAVGARAVEIEDERALAPLFAKLRACKERVRTRVRVTHWGDSHITSDIISGELRQRLQAEFGDGGPGFVLLGKPWPSYRHAQVATGADSGWRSERLWAKYGRGRLQPRDDLFGVPGISVHALQGAVTWAEGRARRTLRTADLYYLLQPGGGRIELLVGGKRLRWLFTVASEKEAAVARVDLPDGTRRVELAASLGEVRLYGVDFTSGARGVVYDTLGLNGGRAAAMLQWNEALMTYQLARLAPDLIVVAFGSNEVDNERLSRSAFATTFDDVLRRLRKMTPGASCLVLGPTDQGRYRRRQGWVIPEQLAIIVDEQRRVAKLRGCAFWDQRAAMGGHGSIVSWMRAAPQLAQTDRVHLTGEGYRQLGAALFQSLMTHLARYQPGANFRHISAHRLSLRHP
jgi:lysophospholipase L1-like esterase